MFKRWLKLLGVSLLLQIAIIAFLSYRHEGTYSVAETCMNYLKSVSDSWSSKNDNFYQTTCSYDNRYSEASLEVFVRENIIESIHFLAITFLVSLSILLISFILRWLFVGRLT